MDNSYDYNEIIKALSKMSYLNIISFCILSGCGIKENRQNSDFYNIYKKIQNNKAQNEYTNVSFNTALFKSAMPAYINKIDNYYDFQSYLWKDKKIKKAITPTTQSLSISCMILAAQKIISKEIEIENKEFIIFCLIYSAERQLSFMYRHLVQNNLLFKCKFREELVFKLDEESLNILPQYLGCEAAILTLELIKSTGLSNYFSLDYKNFFNNILSDLCEIAIKDSLYLSTRKLSQICDSLISIYNYTGIYKELLYNTINILGNEICERIENSGELLRKPLDSKISSFFTICHSLSILSKLYYINPLDNYISSVDKLYASLTTLWNDNHKLYLKNRNKKIPYSIKEIAALFSALKNYRNICCSESVKNIDYIISSCYNSMILKSGIFINQYYPILENSKISLSKTNNTSKRKPPIFIKKIQYKVEKKKFEKIDESFNAEYSLWACKQFL